MGTLGTLIVFCMLGCADSDSATPEPGDDGVQDDLQNTKCETARGVFAVAPVVAKASHACHDRVSPLVGRVLYSTGASASVWSLRTPSKVGIAVGAAHTRGEGFFGPGGTSIPEALSLPENALPLAQLPNATASGPNPLSLGWFLLYHPEIPAGESGNTLTKILPRHDFWVALVDAQQLSPEQLPGPMVKARPPISDPAELTTKAPTFAAVRSGESALAMGYPRAGAFAGKLAATVGKVLSDAESVKVVADLKAAGDDEGDVAYDSEAEFLVRAPSIVGMSGSGVFNAQGRWIGILVRGTEKRVGGSLYFRAVRASYVVQRLTNALGQLSPTRRKAFAPYVETP